jgi:hypothetical protein
VKSHQQPFEKRYGPFRVTFNDKTIVCVPRFAVVEFQGNATNKINPLPKYNAVRQ